MSTIPPPGLAESAPRPPLHPTLVLWMAVQTLNTRYARLVDGGADADAQVELATLFVDLPVRTTMAIGPGLSSARKAMPALLGSSPRRSRWLLIGGPGSGKSTLTTMLAHVLRRPWIGRQIDALTAPQQTHWAKYGERFEAGLKDFTWANVDGALPIRIELPNLSQWLASREKAPTDSLWDYLAFRANKELGLVGIQVDMTTSEWQSALTAAGAIYWILDGLDEVPHVNDRKRLLEFVRAVVFSKPHQSDALVVSTRPQGYSAEFDELDDMELQKLDPSEALAYGHRLLEAYIPPSPLLEEKREELEAEFGNENVRELLQTPLHTTMAALLVARIGSLPNARCKLFDAYFDMVFRRELGKPFEKGIQVEDESILRDLHRRIGLTLHVRAQEGTGVQPSLRRRDLRRILEQIYTEQGYRGDDLHTRVERMMRFAMDRLVLLLHSTEGEYTFGIRSLEEYFAADALLEGETETVYRRLVDIVLNPHWLNVFEIMTSRLALVTERAQQKRALRLTAELYADMNAGRIGGEAAKRCFSGSRMAIAILGSVLEYAHPWLIEPLWRVAFELASTHQDGIMHLAKSQLVQGKELVWTDITDMHALLSCIAFDIGRQDDILSASRMQLETADPATQLNGWRLLGPLLEEGSQAALELANQHLPSSPEMAHDIVQALLDFPQTRNWLWSFIEKRIDWLTPCFGDVFHLDTNEEGPITLLIHRALLARGNSSDDGGYFYMRETDPFVLPLVLIGPDHDPEWADLAARSPDTTPAWHAWKRIAEFHAQPTHESLADVLEAASEPSGFADIQTMNYYFSWPLLTCLDHVYRSNDLVALADVIRQGQLGTVDDWRAAEKRWQTSPSLTLDEIRAALDTDTPWRPDIAERGLVLTSLFQIHDRDHANSKALNEWLSQRIDGKEPFMPLVAQLFSRTMHAESHYPSKIVAMILESLAKHLEQHGKPPGSELPLEPPKHATPRDILVWNLGEQAVIEAENQDPATFLQNLFTNLHAPSAFTAFMTSLVSKGEQAAETLVTALNDPENASGAEQNFLIAPLFAQLRDAVKPAFATEAQWTHHDLPSPFLAAQPPAPHPAQLVQLVDLRNIRLFKEPPFVDTRFPSSSPDHGQWLVFIGENGVGKTTLLRALALALAPPAIATKLLDERFPMLTNGSDGHIAIDLDTGALAVTIRRDQRTEILETSTRDAFRPWVVAYGVRRGNARGEKDRDPETGPIGELHTLFDRPASLHNASVWLSKLEADMWRERGKAPKDAPPGPRELVWNAVVAALKELLKVQDIEIEVGSVVMVKHEAFGRVPLDALSDGYLTTAGWVIDMIARWIERQRELDERLDEHWMKQMKGFVLLDEIDLHLHPVWQMNIIEDIRRLFPRLSFIVTTHNPLTLQGARKGEIYIIRRENKGIHFVQKDIRPGQDVDRVLFEQFGIQYTFDQKTRELLTQQRDMIARGVDRNDPGRKDIESQLTNHLGLVGDTVARESESGPLRAEERHLTAKLRKKSAS